MIEQIPETNELFDAVRELEEYIVDLQSEIDYYSSEKSNASQHLDNLIRVLRDANLVKIK